VLRQLPPDDVCEFLGIHLFSGTQILQHRVLVRQYQRGVDIARRASHITGRPIQVIDFGGGLGIPYFENDTALDLDALGRELPELVKVVDGIPELRDARLVLEPGRFLVGEAGIYVTRVTDVKTSRGRTFVITDGGMNHHLAASGNLGQVIRRNFPLAIVNKLTQSEITRVHVVGPLCTPLDVLGRDVSVPTVAVGDLVGVFQSGAYARSASPLGFLSHATPPEVLVRDGAVTLIRRRGRRDDLLRDTAECGARPT
jgi:diaminopimelate decarboxylase